MSADQRELRGLADANLVTALDAIAHAKGLDRNAYINQVLSAHVKRYSSEFRLVSKMCRDNPLFMDDTGSTKEWE